MKLSVKEYYKILNSKVPHHPCNRCNHISDCSSSCTDLIQYEEEIDYLKQLGLLDILKQITSLKIQIQSLNTAKIKYHDAYQNLLNSCDDLGIDICKLDLPNVIN